VIKTFSTIPADAIDCSSAIEKFLAPKFFAEAKPATAVSIRTCFRKEAGVSVFAGEFPVENLSVRSIPAGSLSGEMPDACLTGLVDLIHCSKAN
jgi:hypothetical protein